MKQLTSPPSSSCISGPNPGCCPCRDLESPQVQSELRSTKERSERTRAGATISRWILYWHCCSILLCASLFCQSILASAATVTKKDSVRFEDLGGHPPELEDPGGFDEDEEDFDSSRYTQRISIRVNPLLRHRRQSFQKPERQMCHVWTRHSPNDLCNKGRWARLRQLRELSVFSKDCSDESTNVQLGELFRLEWPKIKSEADLLSHTEHLKSGSLGRDCLTASPRSSECLACYQRIDEAFQVMDEAYDAFNRTLRRFDCMLAVDISSATRPFSPNGTCEDCKKWYRKWLLVQLLDIWKEPPCINWCYYAQLACPHLAPSRQVDYAGHPSFLCRDRKITYSSGEELQSSCTCFHPCDILRTPPEPPGWYEKNKHRPSILKGYDFFASNEHCWARKRRCDFERTLRESGVDGNRLPRDREQPESNSLPDYSSNSQKNNGNKFSGYIDDAPAELFNQLGAWFFPSLGSVSSNQVEHRHPHRRFERDSPTSSSSQTAIQHLSFVLFAFLHLLRITFDLVQR